MRLSICTSSESSRCPLILETFRLPHGALFYLYLGYGRHSEKSQAEYLAAEHRGRSVLLSMVKTKINNNSQAIQHPGRAGAQPGNHCLNWIPRDCTLYTVPRSLIIICQKYKCVLFTDRTGLRFVFVEMRVKGLPASVGASVPRQRKPFTAWPARRCAHRKLLPARANAGPTPEEMEAAMKSPEVRLWNEIVGTACRF